MEHRIMIAGPTASGKSSLAVNLAEFINAEIISVDSRQCYKQIDIGTAKPTEDQLSRIHHHNISLFDLHEEDSAAAFTKRAAAYAQDIEKRGRRVIYCGGSTLHLQTVISPLDKVPSSNPHNIASLNEKAEKEGVEVLYQKLLEVDREYAQKMDGMNRQRVIRALDVWMQTGKPFSSFHKRDPVTLTEGLFVVALHHPRERLHQRIAMRTGQMIENGLVEETRKILESGYSPDAQALQTVGYRQAIQFLKGELSHQQMVDRINTATRRYARRQIIWLRRWPFIHWIDMSEKSEREWIEWIRAQTVLTP